MLLVGFMVVSGRWGAVIINIKSIVNDLIKKYKTNDPYELASLLKITVKDAPLHEDIKGMYQYVDRNKFIYINSNLLYHTKKSTCGHELGHAILHPKTNCIFLRDYTLFSPSKLEKEANLFAAHLLLTDDVIMQYDGFTYEQISCDTGIPVEYIKLIK